MTDDKTPAEKFDETLGKLLSVSKKRLDEALEAGKELVEEVEQSIKPASDDEPGE